MYRTWSASAPDLETLERVLGQFLNEYVEDLVSISYSVHDRHNVLVVYRPVDLESSRQAEATVIAAEEFIERLEEQETQGTAVDEPA